MTASINYAANVSIKVPDDGTTEMTPEYSVGEKFRPGSIYVKYFVTEGEWVLSSAEVAGPLIRKNGTLSSAVSRRRSYRNYTNSDNVSTMPPHLLALVEENRPAPLTVR